MKILLLRNSCNVASQAQIGYGLGVVATVISNAGYNVRAIDNNSFYKYYQERDFAKAIRKYNPDVVGWSITIHNAYESYRQMKNFKAKFPNILMLAGGVHMRHCSEEALRYGADIVVNYEAETVIVPLLKHIETNGISRFRSGLDLVSGVSYLNTDGTMHIATELPALENLDEVPIVNYDLINVEDYIKHGKEPGVFYVTGQRGCPFKCNYCYDEIQRGDKRVSSAEWMFNNAVDLQKRYDISYLTIADNNFTFPRERAVEFCNRVIQSGLNKKLSFSCQTNVLFPLDQELIKLMRKANFVRVNFGLERLTQYSLKRISKNNKYKNVRKAVKSVEENGIQPTIYMMIGFPFDNKEILEEEKGLFLDLGVQNDRYLLSVLCPTPGTTYYDRSPEMKEWYLNKREHLVFRAHFTNVLDLHATHLIKKNFFNLSVEVQKSLYDYYYFFKKRNHGSVLMKHTFVVDAVLKIDVVIAKISQALFYLSPTLEFVVFNRVKAVRYFLGSYFFHDNLVSSQEKAL